MAPPTTADELRRHRQGRRANRRTCTADAPARPRCTRQRRPRPGRAGWSERGGVRGPGVGPARSDGLAGLTRSDSGGADRTGRQTHNTPTGQHQRLHTCPQAQRLAVRLAEQRGPPRCWICGACTKRGLARSGPLKRQSPRRYPGASPTLGPVQRWRVASPHCSRPSASTRAYYRRSPLQSSKSPTWPGICARQPAEAGGRGRPAP